MTSAAAEAVALVRRLPDLGPVTSHTQSPPLPNARRKGSIGGSTIGLVCRGDFDGAVVRIFQFDPRTWDPDFVKYTSAGVKNEALIALLGKQLIDADAKSASEILYAAPVADPELPFAYVCPDVILRRKGQPDIYCQIKYKAKSEGNPDAKSIHYNCDEKVKNTRSCKCILPWWHADQMCWEGKVSGGNTNYYVAGTLLKGAEFIPLKPVYYKDWWTSNRDIVVKFFDRYLAWYWLDVRTPKYTAHIRRVVLQHNAETEFSDELATMTDDPVKKKELQDRASRPFINIEELLLMRPESQEDIRKCRAWYQMRRATADLAKQLSHVVASVVSLAGLNAYPAREAAAIAIGRNSAAAVKPQRIHSTGAAAAAAAAAAAMEDDDTGAGCDILKTASKVIRKRTHDDMNYEGRVLDDAVKLASAACMIGYGPDAVRDYIERSAPLVLNSREIWLRTITYLCAHHAGKAQNSSATITCQCGEIECKTSTIRSDAKKRYFADMMSSLLTLLTRREPFDDLPGVLHKSSGCFGAVCAILDRWGSPNVLLPGGADNYSTSRYLLTRAADDAFESKEKDPRFGRCFVRLMDVSDPEVVSGTCACRSILTHMFLAEMRQPSENMWGAHFVARLFDLAHSDGDGPVSVLNMGFDTVLQWCASNRYDPATRTYELNNRCVAPLDVVLTAARAAETRITHYRAGFDDALRSALCNVLPVSALYPLIHKLVIHPLRATQLCGSGGGCSAPNITAAADATAAAASYSARQN